MIEPLGIDLVAFKMLDKYKSVKITIIKKINDKKCQNILTK